MLTGPVGCMIKKKKKNTRSNHLTCKDDSNCSTTIIFITSKVSEPKKMMVEAARDFQFSVKNLNEAA